MNRRSMARRQSLLCAIGIMAGISAALAETPDKAGPPATAAGPLSSEVAASGSDWPRWRGPDANSLFAAEGHPLPAMNVLGLQPETAHLIP